MTVDQFVEKWRRVSVTERSASQTHFNELCELLGVDKPLDVDPEGKFYAFERHVSKAAGGKGFADVWKRGHFAWEYKGKRRNLHDAYLQLLLYRDDLDNPPLLIVSDIERIEIHTNFTGTTKKVHVLTLADLMVPEKLGLLRQAFNEPNELNPKWQRERITEEATAKIGEIALRLRDRDYDSEDVAHFVMQLVFCLFAEDAGLLPNRIVTKILERTNEVEALRQKCDSSERAYPLLVAHEKLDEAVAAAYGWEWPLEEEEILGRLLRLNLERYATEQKRLATTLA